MKINQLPFANLEIKLKVGKMFVCHILNFFWLKKKNNKLFLILLEKL